MVFYLKYRPQKFDQLDIKSARERLINIFSSGRIPHAFLFCGPKGTGKTSAARIVAKAVNCEKKGNFEPCNKCPTCKAITAGRHLDVLEIDGASNRGIDEIRDLRERIKLAPSSAKYKVYIIDEVHMLTQEAFNALLKTLEEPPRHAIFVLATTRVDKLPETITSRCVRIDFKRATQEEIVRSLKRVVKGERFKVKKDVLEFIAQEADGSFREGVKILEEASLQPKADGPLAHLGKITLKGVQKILGKDKDFAREDLLGWLVKKDAKKALEWLNEASEKGVDLKVLTHSLLEQLHGMLMGKFGVSTEQLTNQMTEQLNTEDLKELIALFSRAYQELKIAIIPSLPLELAIVEWCEKKN